MVLVFHYHQCNPHPRFSHLVSKTLLNYISILQDKGIDDNSKPSIFELVEKWKTKNPNWNKSNEQTEEVEEVAEVETQVGGVEESDEPVNLSSTTQQTGMSLGELNASLEPEEIKRKEEKETWEALTVVAKPNETHEANGFEFQYEFDEVGKPIYRRRKKGVDTWETLDPEAGGDQQDAYYAVSGAVSYTHLTLPTKA